MGDLIEQVAREICQYAGGQNQGIPWTAYKGHVHATIKALRRIEPTQKMIDAAWRADPLRCDVSESDRSEMYTAIWDAMIGELR